VAGGTLVQHLKTGVDHTAGRAVAEAHTIEVEARSRLRRILGLGMRTTLMVNSSHHQAWRCWRWLVRAAWSPDDGVVEAAEGHGDQFLMGVQWHPERVLEEKQGGAVPVPVVCGCGGGVGAAHDQRVGRD